ncbi:MAG: MtnX-like HAD-IB family phosphatase [Acidobacteriota bacterium]
MTDATSIVFLDFDGTITRGDATDAILEAFAPATWRGIEDAWLAGQIGSRECLAAQMALVTASDADVNRLLDHVEIEPGFVTLLDVCASHAAPVHIVSDGFDYCIHRILGRPALNLAGRLAESRIISSHLEPLGGRWRAAFPEPAGGCAHGCATCKPAAMARLNATGALAVFVGDGRSDRYAATAADVVFAKGALASDCEQASIPFLRYDTLVDVARGLDRLLAAGVQPRLYREG